MSNKMSDNFDRFELEETVFFLCSYGSSEFINSGTITSIKTDYGTDMLTITDISGKTLSVSEFNAYRSIEALIESRFAEFEFEFEFDDE